jgi:hypothetical protein
MKIIYLLISFALFYSGLYGQIIINSDDMANDNDEFIVSNSFELSFDPNATGEDYSWDFTELISFSQDTVEFAGISSMPFILQFIFNNPFDPGYQATEARKLNNIDLIPQIPIDDAYLFTKNSSSKIEELGYGVSFAGVDLPIQYDNKKTLYEFPLAYGNSANDDYSFSIEVPGLGYLGESGNRSYEVDGWGSLSTSFGTFEVLRTKIEHIYEDTIYIDSSEFGITIPRELLVYEWLAEEGGIPLLQITTEFGIVTSVIYQDSLITTGINEMIAEENHFSLYPQPATDQVNIFFDHLPESNINIIIYDLSGKEVYKEVFPGQKNIRFSSSAFSPGLYMLEIKMETHTKVEKLIIR